MALLATSGIAGINRAPRTGRSRWWAVVSVLLFAGTLAQAQPTAAPEYQIKAAFLFNFAQFVEWPPTAFPDAESPLIIGVLGTDPFGPYLNHIVQGEKSGNRPILVEHYQRAEEISRCHILFINYAEPERLDAAFANLKGRSILTVSDVAGFARRGGMIRFLNVNNKIRMRINIEAAKAASLILSSKLLRPAEVVTTTKE